MSFQTKFDQMMKEFFKRVATHFNSSEEEIYAIWEGREIKDKKSPSKKTPEREPAHENLEEKKEQKKDEHELTREKIISPNTTKDMLASFCEKKGLKKSGKKEDLIQRLLDWLKSSSHPEQPKPSSAPPKKSSSEEPSVIKQSKEQAGELAIRRNKFGNFEHMQTGLVFNPAKKKVYARQLPNGDLKDLTAEDIELCNKYKLPYNLPENLNVGKNLDDIKIDEMEEEEELDEEDIEEEELEEEDDPQEEDI